MNKAVHEAMVVWSRDGTAHAPSFDDIYFSRGDGLAEANHVFVAGNALPERFPSADSFVLVETGFGTGLNYMATREAWRQHRRGNATLHYLSIELFPVAATHMLRLARTHGHLREHLDELVTALPPIERGVHTLQLSDGVTLSLLYMDLEDALPLIADVCGPRVDAWYLDGFAPSKNPEMWTPDLFRTMASHGGTFATFTVAGAVRRGLTEAGFVVEKVPGAGMKREMSWGTETTEVRSERRGNGLGRDVP